MWLSKGRRSTHTNKGWDSCLVICLIWHSLSFSCTRRFPADGSQIIFPKYTDILGEILSQLMKSFLRHEYSSSSMQTEQKGLWGKCNIKRAVVQSKSPYPSTNIMWIVPKVHVSSIGYNAVLVTYGSGLTEVREPWGIIFKKSNTNSYQHCIYPRTPVDTKSEPWKKHKGCPGGLDQYPAIPSILSLITRYTI